MEISYSLTQADFYRSFLAHRNRNTFSKWLFRLLVPFCLLLVVASFLIFAFSRNADTVSNVKPLGSLALVWILIVWGAPWWSARRQFRGQPAAQGERSLVIDGDGIHCRWEGGY